MYNDIATKFVRMKAKLSTYFYVPEGGASQTHTKSARHSAQDD